MADNYLEKRMDDYRSGRLSTGRQTVVTRMRGTSPGGLHIPFPDLRVLVVSRDMSELASEIVRLSRSVGLRVAVMSDNRKAATSLSQSQGARMYLSFAPEAVMDNLRHHWGGVDIILDEDGVFTESDGYRLIRLHDLDVPVETLARFYLFVSHPDNSFFTMS